MFYANPLFTQVLINIFEVNLIISQLHINLRFKKGIFKNEKFCKEIIFMELKFKTNTIHDSIVYGLVKWAVTPNKKTSSP